MKRILKAIGIWVWCFPQQLAGLTLRIITRAKKKDDHYEYNFKGGSISLGTYVFLCPSHWNDERVLKHEKGHTVQSNILGWLYLPIIGLPSVIWANCFGWYRKKYNKSYYDFYTERSADELGGVER